MAGVPSSRSFRAIRWPREVRELVAGVTGVFGLVLFVITLIGVIAAPVIVYLRSLKPIRNPLPRSAVPFPLNRLIAGVPQPVNGPVTADVSTPEKRGQHIVEIGICADCHTTRDDGGEARELSNRRARAPDR